MKRTFLRNHSFFVPCLQFDVKKMRGKKNEGMLHLSLSSLAAFATEQCCFNF